MEENSDVLVSVCVIAYNSSDTIIETLESIYNQTYRRLELIIGDDASTDNTISLCEEWLKCKSGRFESFKIVTSDRNSGVPANCNKTLSFVSGKWIKLIAADDLLLPEAITNLIRFVIKYPEIEFVYTPYYVFEEINSEKKIIEIRPSQKFVDRMRVISGNNQLYTYIKSGVNITVSLFYSRRLYLSSGGFDVKYRLFEDTPWIVKVLLSGEVLYYDNVKTIMYRVGHSSITHDYAKERKKYFIKEDFYNCVQNFRREQVYPIMPKLDLLFWIDEYSNRIQNWLVINILRNKRNFLTEILYYMFKLLNPYFGLRYFISKLR